MKPQAARSPMLCGTNEEFMHLTSNPAWSKILKHISIPMFFNHHPLRPKKSATLQGNTFFELGIIIGEHDLSG
jgi:hypothetical protein